MTNNCWQNNNNFQCNNYLQLIYCLLDGIFFDMNELCVRPSFATIVYFLSISSLIFLWTINVCTDVNCKYEISVEFQNFCWFEKKNHNCRVMKFQISAELQIFACPCERSIYILNMSKGLTVPDDRKAHWVPPGRESLQVFL